MRWIVVGVLAVTLLNLLAGSVTAHKEQLPGDALTLVRQAAALLAQNPAMTDEIKERLEAALKSPKPQGVRMTDVAEALKAADKGDIASARRFLVDAIVSAGVPAASQDEQQGQPSVPAAPGALPATRPSPSVETAMKMAEPLRTRFAGSPVEDFLLALAVAFVGLGIVLLWRDREEARS